MQGGQYLKIQLQLPLQFKVILILSMMKQRNDLSSIEKATIETDLTKNDLKWETEKEEE